MPFYPSIPASDGTSLVAPSNAVFRVFELSDTEFTKPLELVSTSGQGASPLTTTPQGVVPPVNVISPNLSHIFKSGDWEWRRDSFDGAAAAVGVSRSAAEKSREEAEKSRKAAEAAALEAQAPTDAMVERGILRADIPGRIASQLSNLPLVSAMITEHGTSLYLNGQEL